MSRVFWDDVRVLFETALDQQPVDVASWLAERTPDTAVRQEVASLLDHHAHAGTFLEQPVLDPIFDPDELGGFDALATGAAIGPYTVVREIGRGGMGRVYEAVDNRLGRSVAVKALRPHAMRDPAARERLRREARAAARLSPPGICAIYALEEQDEQLFLINEYVEGRTLRDDIDAGERPSIETIVRVAGELASALAAAHARGVIHRDLKPANIIRTPDGGVKILDFGLAQISDAAQAGSKDGFTLPGVLAGTPAAMAPEQIEGRPADARTDLFALGILLYEFALGVAPFSGETPIAVMGRVLAAEPAPVEVVRPEIPQGLAMVIERCLKKSPAERFGSADELLAGLERVFNGQPPRPAPSRRWWRVHQAAMLVLYFTAAAAAWQIKEWQRAPILLGIFLATVVLTAAAGILRGHLLFCEWADPSHLPEALQREGRITMRLDLSIAGLALAGALYVAARYPLAAALTMALGMGFGLAALTIEPATTRAAFEKR